MTMTNAHAKVLRRQWGGEYYGILDDADRSNPAQGADDTPALYLFDSARQLCFLWSGNADQPVEVSYGGFGEPVGWRFNFEDHKPTTPVAGTLGLTTAFAFACRQWIDAKEDAR